jgi:hypothetical protein
LPCGNGVVGDCSRNNRHCEQRKTYDVVRVGVRVRIRVRVRVRVRVTVRVRVRVTVRVRVRVTNVGMCA